MSWMHVCEQRLASEMNVAPIQPRPPHFRRIARSPPGSGEAEAQLDAFSIRQMEQARVADGLVRFAMNDEPLAEAEARLAFAIASDASAGVFQGGIRPAGDELHHLHIREPREGFLGV